MTRRGSIGGVGLVLAVLLSACGTGGGGVSAGSGGAPGGSGAPGSGGAPGQTGGSGGGGNSGTSGGSATGGGQAGAPATGGAGAGGTTPTPANLLVTSASGDYWKAGTFGLTTAGEANVVVDDAVTAQVWEGFGGAFNEIGWSLLASKELQDQAVRLLFSATEGANFAWGLVPIGATDYATSRYTLDDTGTDVTPDSGGTNRPPADLALSKFSLERDSQMLIPYVKAAQAVKPDLRFWASAWTPPVWMKTGYKVSSGVDATQPAKKPSYYDGGSMRSDAAILSAYAQYFARFVQAYRDRGIDIEVVAPQNEPTFDQNHPSCLWDKSTYAAFVGKFLGPAMKELNVRVMLGLMSNANTSGDLDIASTVLADSTATSFLGVAGVQWNVLDSVNAGTTMGGLPIWVTTHKAGNYPFCAAVSSYCPGPYNPSQAPNDQAYGVESWGYIRNAITKGRVTAYNAWNMVLDKIGMGNDTTREWKQDALLVVDGGKVEATPAYYVFRHLSQYVVPGAMVVGTTGGDAVAFKNPDGSLVAVAYNSGAANSNFVVAMGGAKLQFAMPASGWATVKYTP